jgi:hypothetical protein
MLEGAHCPAVMPCSVFVPGSAWSAALLISHEGGDFEGATAAALSGRNVDNMNLEAIWPSR